MSATKSQAATIRRHEPALSASPQARHLSDESETLLNEDDHIFPEWYAFLVLQSLWIGWLVSVLSLSLIARFVPVARWLNTASRYILWAGVAAFFIWMTEGRVALFVAMGFVIALALLLLWAFIRAPSPDRSRLPIATKMMIAPALIWGSVVGVVVEFAGRWSGGPFVVWRGLVGAAAVLVVGLIFVERTIQR
jgi:hypothetical protein